MKTQLENNDTFINEMKTTFQHTPRVLVCTFTLSAPTAYQPALPAEYSVIDFFFTLVEKVLLDHAKRVELPSSRFPTTKFFCSTPIPKEDAAEYRCALMINGDYVSSIGNCQQLDLTKPTMELASVLAACWLTALDVGKVKTLTQEEIKTFIRFTDAVSPPEMLIINHYVE